MSYYGIHDPRDPYGTWIDNISLSKEQEVRQAIQLGKDRDSISTRQMVRYDGEEIKAWVVFQNQMQESALNEDEINYPERFINAATNNILEEYEYLKHLTLIDVKICKNYSAETHSYLYQAKFYFSNPELLYLQDEKPHLFV